MNVLSEVLFVTLGLYTYSAVMLRYIKPGPNMNIVQTLPKVQGYKSFILIKYLRHWKMTLLHIMFLW